MKFIAKTLYGLEEVLSSELVSLGALNIKAVNRAVLFEGGKDMLYRSNYCLRTALSVLVPVREFRIRSKDDLYRGASAIAWDKYLSPDGTFAVTPVVKSPLFEHSGYPGLVVKDAVADHFRKSGGKRPSVRQDEPDLLINLHISNDLVTISLDSSVVPLFKRGYRKEQSAAPINEVLAAGIILISGWNAGSDFLDPMCGSGTFPIEAGMIACRIPPGKSRGNYGFNLWKDFDPVLFDEIRSEYARMETAPSVKISASDISENAVKQSLVNIEAAGLKDVIVPEAADFRELRGSVNGGTMFINPPYGLRLNPDELDNLYSMTGTVLKHNFPGWSAWIITPNLEALKHVGLKPAKKHILYNGSLECTLLKYELYSGSRKKNLQSDNAN
jgi:putative N6-adenine-specific DNA methylase